MSSGVLQPPGGLVIRPRRRESWLDMWQRKLDQWLNSWESMYLEEKVGEAGTEMECTPPCFSIKGYTHEYFSVVGCGCDTFASHRKDGDGGLVKWDGVFRMWRTASEVLPGTGEVIPPLRECLWQTKLHFGEYIGSGLSGVSLAHRGPKDLPPEWDFDQLSTFLRPITNSAGEKVWEIVVNCIKDGEGGPGGPDAILMWRGENTTRDPDTSPYTQLGGTEGGCSGYPAELEIERASGHGCFCDPFVLCPEANTGCESCPDKFYVQMEGWLIDGLPDSSYPPGCDPTVDDDFIPRACFDRLNNCFEFSKEGSNCSWALSPAYAGGDCPLGIFDWGDVQCRDFDNNEQNLPRGTWALGGKWGKWGLMGRGDCPDMSIGRSFDIHAPCSDCGPQVARGTIVGKCN